MSVGLCWGHKGIAEIVHIDDLERGFCGDCAAVQPVPKEALLAAWIAANPPFLEGDRVECRTAGQVYDGVGVVAQVSTDPVDLATPICPMFRVVMEKKAYDEMTDEGWYSGICLTRVDA